jgi:hypothetical protein
VDYGEQVRPLEAPNHLVVVRTYRRRIRVVNEQSLDRRIVEVLSVLPSSTMFTARASTRAGYPTMRVEELFQAAVESNL